MAKAIAVPADTALWAARPPGVAPQWHSRNKVVLAAPFALLHGFSAGNHHGVPTLLFPAGRARLLHHRQKAPEQVQLCSRRAGPSQLSFDWLKTSATKDSTRITAERHHQRVDTDRRPRARQQRRNSRAAGEARTAGGQSPRARRHAHGGRCADRHQRREWPAEELMPSSSRAATSRCTRPSSPPTAASCPASTTSWVHRGGPDHVASTSRSTRTGTTATTSTTSRLLPPVPAAGRPARPAVPVAVDTCSSGTSCSGADSRSRADGEPAQHHSARCSCSAARGQTSRRGSRSTTGGARSALRRSARTSYWVGTSACSSTASRRLSTGPRS